MAWRSQERHIEGHRARETWRPRGRGNPSARTRSSLLLETSPGLADLGGSIFSLLRWIAHPSKLAGSDRSRVPARHSPHGKHIGGAGPPQSANRRSTSPHPLAFHSRPCSASSRSTNAIQYFWRLRSYQEHSGWQYGKYLGRNSLLPRYPGNSTPNNSFTTRKT